MPETDQFEHFQVLRRPDGSLWELGRGAMGVTYKAFDTNLRCDVALKVISPQYLNSETAQQRFLREARAAAQLRHPNVATVFHLGSSAGSFFYAMEYVEGETVEHRVQRAGSLAPELALRITRQVVRALIAAHKQNLVHRDIKPPNIMLVHDDSEDHLLVKVIDFGLAKSLSSGADQSATVTLGGFVGTPHFASPEQLEERDIDIRSDIYSLGATLWFMLTGKPPYQGSMASVIHQHLGSPLCSEVLATLHPCVRGIVEKCLAKKPNDRFPTPPELKQALDEALTELESNNPTLVTPMRQSGALASELSSTAEFATGEIIRNRYEILGQSPLDLTLFKAKDLQSTQVLALRPFTEAARFDTQQPGDFRTEIGRLLNIHHPNLTRVYGIEPSDRGSFILSEWVRGFSFQDLLRARRLLEWEETLRLVRSLAKVLDFLADKRLLNTNLTLRNLYVEPTDSKNDVLELRRLPVTEWSPFIVKVDTLSLGTTLQPQFVAPTQKVASAGRGSAVQTAPQQLARLVYELLGGPSLPTKTPHPNFPPLSVLSESGNGVLRSALVDPGRFGSASNFLAALEQAEIQTDREVISTQSPSGVLPAVPGDHVGSESDLAEDEDLEEQPRTSPLLLRIVTAVAGVFVLFAVTGVLVFSVFFRKSELVKPALHEGFITITSKPDGAAVKLNGRELGKTPLVKYQLPLGKQVLQIESPGYQTRSVEADIGNDALNNLGQVVLVRDVGQFVVKTNPPGVPFEIIDWENKVTSGVTPLTVQNMPSGKYQVKLKRPGWPDIVQEADLVANASVAVQHTFQGISVSFKSDPDGATIYLAGVAIGKAPFNYSLPAGQVELTSKIGSLASVTQRVTPNPDGTSTIEFKHVYGFVSVTTDRADAEVLIGGINLGRAPIEGILPPGKHQIVVKASGSPDQSRTADVQANRRVVMQFTFGGGASGTSQANSIDQNSPTAKATPVPGSPTPVGPAKPTNTVFHGNTFPTIGATSSPSPSPGPSIAPNRPRASVAPVYRTKEDWEQAKKEAFRKFDSDWNARKDAMKQQKKYLEYWIDHSSGAAKEQWKYKKQLLEDKMSQLDQQKDQAKDDLKRRWND